MVQIEREIVSLWNGVEDAIEGIRQKANFAVEQAWKIGHKLIDAKKQLGHGNFGLWQERIGIPQTTASRYMALAAKFPNLVDLPENKRSAYLAIGLLPDKDSVNHEGDTALSSSPHYLQFFNRWNNWHTQVEAGKKTFVVTDDVRKELKPMFEWMKKEIYGET